MDSTVPRSTIPVAIEVASDEEPVSCEGSVALGEHGFTLAFYIGDDKYTVDHSDERTSVTAEGLMTYTLVFTDGITHTAFSTPYGVLDFDVQTASRRADVSADGVKIGLSYLLVGGGKQSPRKLDIFARFADR